MLVGNYLNQSEINELISSFKNKTKFQNLVREMQDHGNFEFNEENVEVVQALKLDLAKGEDVISGKTLYLKVDQNVNIQYIIRFLNGDEQTTNDFFIGTIVHPDIENEGGYLQTSFQARHDTFVSLSESRFGKDEVNIASERDAKSREEFPIDENYYPGMLLEQVGTEAWYSGCLPGGYIWCGEGCGGSVACTSSLAGINGLDGCCKMHDCCYHIWGVKHPFCHCDQQLCDCSKKVPWQFNTPFVQLSMCWGC